MLKKLSLLISNVLLIFSLIVLGGARPSQAASPASGSTVVQNASFEIAGAGGAADAADWNEGVNHTRANDKFNTGSWSLKSTFTNVGGTNTNQTVAVLPNSTYTYAVYFWKSATNNGSGTCADMSDIAGETQLCANVTGVWQFKSGAWNSGAATSVRLRLITDGAPNAGSWFDDVSLAPLATPTPLSTHTATPTLAEIPTSTVTPTDPPTPTDVPALTETLTPTDLPTSTEIPTNDSTPTDAPTSTETPASTPTSIEILVATETPTDTPTPTDIPTLTATPTTTPTPTDLPTSTVAPTNTPSPTPIPVLSSNVVQNPSFEIAGDSSADAASWVEGVNHTRASDKFNTGSWSLKSTFTGAGGATTSQIVAVLPNLTYTYSMYFWKSATNKNSGTCADMSDIGGEVQLCASSNISAWQFKSGTWNSGSNTTIQLRLITDGAPNAGSWFDDISLAPLATPTPTLTRTPTPTLCPDCPTPTPSPTLDTVIVAGAGDIACGAGSTGAACMQMATSNLLLAINPDLVLTFGDTQYEAGALSDYNQGFDPSWGRLKAKISPSVGNHEYGIGAAAGYFDYFNGVGNFSGPAGDRNKGYYSYDLGNWHFVALNSNCSLIGGCGAGSAQYLWLQNDLAADTHPCSVAYMHHPFSSSDTRDFDTNTPYQLLMQLFYDDGGELLVVGHSHFYERFARVNVNKQADPDYGFRQIVVGTGGRNVYGFGSIRPLSEVRNGASFGVIKLMLAPGQYTWEFVPAAGSTFTDTGAEACHGAHP